MAPEFLTVDDVLEIHHDQINLYGGQHGTRDLGLLESAVGQPPASFGGNYLHSTIYDMAAAYLFHIVQNHPFIDGNKRAGAMAALVFLDWNEIELRDENEGLVDITLRVASGKAGKPEVAEFFQSIAVS